MKATLALVFVFATAFSVEAVTIDTVPVGNPGNPPDAGTIDSYHRVGMGSVGYNFYIGKSEITNAQYAAFLNAVAATDTYGLYGTFGGIVRSGSSGSFIYSVKAPALSGAYPYDDKPVVYVSSGDAMRFANWLHNGQPTGAQDASTTEDGAYTLNGATSNAALLAVSRNAGARWWLPSEDEWHKAAYHKNDGVTGNYWNYPMGTDSVPNNNPPSGDTGNSAIFYSNGYTTGNSSYPLTDAGAYALSDSPYGTFDQGGNVSEWNQRIFSGSFRGVRGGDWFNSVSSLHAAVYQTNIAPANQYSNVGFRVASIPEPSTLLLGALAGVGLLWLRRAR